ncbi:hypothetical protein PENTCL1PPCAC_1875, partial [Pristionchus entomophagus]
LARNGIGDRPSDLNPTSTRNCRRDTHSQKRSISSCEPTTRTCSIDTESGKRTVGSSIRAGSCTFSKRRRRLSLVILLWLRLNWRWNRSNFSGISTRRSQISWPSK